MFVDIMRGWVGWFWVLVMVRWGEVDVSLKVLLMIVDSEMVF